METTDCKEIDQTSEFLTASQLVSLRKPDEDTIRCVVGEKYYTPSDTWLENKAVECALEGFKDTLYHKRVARICDLMRAEWNEELNASITSKLKGKFVQHMGRACNGKTALTPEESIFLLENGCIEILNDGTPLSTEEAYKIMLKDNLGAEKYQVYSQLSQLGFIVVPHQSELGVTKYEKRINLDKYQSKRKRKTVSEVCGEPEKKRLTFSGAFSNNQSEIAVSSSHRENSSVSTTTEPITEVPLSESIINCHPDESSSSNKKREVKDSDNGAQSEERTKQVLNSLLCLNENASNTADSATMVNADSATTLEEVKEVSAGAVGMIAVNHNSNDECVPQTVSADAPTDISAPVSCVKSSKYGNGLDVDLETAKVGVSVEMPVQEEVGDEMPVQEEVGDEMPVQEEVGDEMPVHEEVGDEMPVQEEVDPQSCSDTNSNIVPIDLSKNSIDVMNIDSENTEISCTSEVSRSNNNVANSNINLTLEDSSCSVMDAVALPDDHNSNSDVMSCFSENDDVLSYDAHSDYGASVNSQEDDEIELLEVTKKETKPLAVIDLLSDEELDTELSGSDDDIQVVRVCNGSITNAKQRNVNSLLRNPYKCKKEEPGSASNYGSTVRLMSFPNCSYRDMVCVARPPSKYLPRNVCPSKEAYVLNFKSKSDHSQPPNRLWNSYKDIREYQRSRQQNRHADHSIPTFPNVSAWDPRRAQPNQRRTILNENNEPRWGGGMSHRDAKRSSNHRPNDQLKQSLFVPSSRRDAKQNFNHRRHDSPKEFSTFQNPERNYWPDRNPAVPLREEGPNFAPNRSINSTEAFPNAHSTNPFSSSHNVHQNPYGRYPVPNASAAAINSVVSVSNQDMNVSMVGNHILHPPLHSSSPHHLPSFNTNLPSMGAIGPVDIMAEVHRTAYTVATSMLSSMFGQNMNPHAMPHLPPFNAFQPPIAQNSSFGFVPRFNSAFNTQNFSSEQFPMQNRPLEPLRRQHHGNPFPCQYKNLRNRTSWNDVREAIGDDKSDSSLDVGSDVEEVPINPTDILWDPNNISPLVKPGIRHPIPEILQKLQVTHAANLISKSLNNVHFSTTCSIEISFDVYLPGTNYRKTCPDIPKHRIIVVRSTDPIPKYSDLAFLQSKWNDGAVLQVAVVDNGDISYQSFNSICLPVLTT